MKTKTLLLLCLLLGIATAQLSAQNGKNGNGSVSLKLYDFEVTVFDFYSPELGFLTGKCTIHLLNAEYDGFGNPIGEKFNCHVTTLTSSITGEEFLANFVTHTSSTSDPDVFVLTVKSVLIGNLGTRLVCTEKFEYNITTGEMVDLEHRHKQW